jgi:hypothetical protein
MMKNRKPALINALVLVTLLATGATINACSNADAQGSNSDPQGGNGSGQFDDTGGQGGDTNEQSGDTNEQSGGTNEQSGDIVEQESDADAPLNAALAEAGVESMAGQIKVVHVKLGEWSAPLTDKIEIIKAPYYRQTPQVNFNQSAPEFSGSAAVAGIVAIRNSGGHLINRETQSRGFVLRPDGNRLPLVYDVNYNEIGSLIMKTPQTTYQDARVGEIRITEEQINLLDDLECNSDSDSGDCATWTAPASNVDGEYYVTLTYAL